MDMRKDLKMRIYARLELWSKDALALYDMGELEVPDAWADVVACLLHMLAKLTVSLKINPTKLLLAYLSLVKRIIAEEEARSTQ